MQAHKANQMGWPTKSPDLNPMEFMAWNKQ